MFELAVVLLVTRKFQLKKNESNGKPDGRKLGKKSKTVDRLFKVGPTEDVEQDSEKLRFEGIRRRPTTRGSNTKDFRRPKKIGIMKLGFIKELSVTDKIDMVSFAAFLFAYFIFNCVYWGYYL